MTHGAGARTASTGPFRRERKAQGAFVTEVGDDLLGRACRAGAPAAAA